MSRRTLGRIQGLPSRIIEVPGTPTGTPQTNGGARYAYDTANDLMYVYDIGAGLWVRTGDQIPHMSSVNVPTTAGTTTSTSFVAVPGTSVTMSFTKHRADTSLIGHGSLQNIYTDTAFGLTSVAISIGGTDYLISELTAGAAGREWHSGITAPVTGVAAGAVTCLLTVKTVSGTLTVDASGIGSLSITETL